MQELIIEIAVKILFTLALVAIECAAVWVLAKMGKHEELSSIAAATDEVIKAAKQSAAAIQQKFVERMKAAAADGKLTHDEVKELNMLLLDMTMKKLSEPAKNVLIAAGKDITAIVMDAGEAWIQKNHKSG